MFYVLVVLLIGLEPSMVSDVITKDQCNTLRKEAIKNNKGVKFQCQKIDQN